MRLTKNFDSKEFDCKDGTKVPEKYLLNCKEVADNLQALRDYLRVPVTITGSGYRTPSHNTKVKGAKFSQHLTASAADINAEGYTPKQLAEVIELLILKGKMKQGGIGTYSNFVHYDIRGTKARW
tara:strand:- start:346 stop:720 length:375 start_codon:yes stop_codon:yes gene_type:complete